MYLSFVLSYFPTFLPPSSTELLDAKRAAASVLQSSHLKKNFLVLPLGKEGMQVQFISLMEKNGKTFLSSI